MRWLLILTLFATLSYAQVVAKINGETINKEELLSAFNAYWREIIHLPIAQATKKDLQDFLVEYIRAKIIEQEAKKMGLQVSSRELNEYITRTVGSVSLSPTVRELAKTELLTNKIVDTVAKGVSVSDKEITAYYYLNLRDFKLPSQVLVERYLAEDLDKANEVYYQLTRGLGVPQKGQPMWYSIQTLPEVVKSQLYPYDIGKVSKPINTGSGYLILRIIDRRGGGILPLEEAKPLVREKLLREKRQEVFRRWFQEVLQNYRVEFYFSQL